MDKEKFKKLKHSSFEIRLELIIFRINCKKYFYDYYLIKASEQKSRLNDQLSAVLGIGISSYWFFF